MFVAETVDISYPVVDIRLVVSEFQGVMKGVDGSLELFGILRKLTFCQLQVGIKECLVNYYGVLICVAGMLVELD